MSTASTRERRRKATPLPCGPGAPIAPHVPRETESERRARLRFGLRDRLAVITQDVRDAHQDAQGAITDPKVMRDLLGAQDALARVLAHLETRK